VKPCPPNPCLIVEDQALLGLSLEAYLAEMGLDICGPLASAAEALGWLATNRPAVAILDHALKDGRCTTLVRTLEERGIPFVIYSGHRRSIAPPELQHVPWINKPCDREVLLAALIRAAPALAERLPRAA
jgi:DNA-binding NtrC family response regulator